MFRRRRQSFQSNMDERIHQMEIVILAIEESPDWNREDILRFMRMDRSYMIIKKAEL